MSDKSLEIMLSLQKDMGKALQGIDNLHGYIKAVSDNQKETRKVLEDHVNEDGAHGVKRTMAVVKWLAAVGPTLVAALAWAIHSNGATHK